MPSNVTVRRPDGTSLKVTEEQAGKLELLGYRRESSDEGAARVKKEAEGEYWSTPVHKAEAAVEGGLAGATFGISDYVLGTDATKKRAEYNSGARLGGELLGAVVPAILTAGGSVAAEAGVTAKTVAGAVARGAGEGAVYGGAAAADHAWLDGQPITAEAVLHGIGWGALLGGALGAGGQAIKAVGNKEAAEVAVARRPIDAYNAKVAAEVERVGAENAAEVAEVDAKNALRASEYKSAVEKLGGPEYDAFAASAKELHKHIGGTVEAADAAVNDVLDKAGQELGAGAKAGLRKHYDAYLRAVDSGNEKAIAAAAEKFQSEVEVVSQRIYVKDAASRGADIARVADKMAGDVGPSEVMGAGRAVEGEGLAQAAAKQAEVPAGGLAKREATEILSEGAGNAGGGEGTRVIKKGATPTPEAAAAPKEVFAEGPPTDIHSAFVPKPPLSSIQKPLDELAKLRASHQALSAFPKSIEEFAALTPAKLERLTAGLETGASVTGNNAARESLGALAEKLGVAGRGEVPALRHVQSSISDALKAAERGEPTQITARLAQPREFAPPKPGKVPKHEGGLLNTLAAYAIGGKAYVAAKAMGVGRAGAYGAFRVAKDAVIHRQLFGARTASLGGIQEAVAAFAPKAGKAMASAGGPAASALAFTLDGNKDQGTKQELARRRVDEIARLAPRVNDALYNAVTPIQGLQPQLAPALHAAAVQAFQALADMVPRDPGIVSGLKSQWKPSPLEAAVLEKQLAVFNNPVGEIRAMLASGHIDPIKVKALQKIAPALYGEFRTQMLMHLAKDSLMDLASYRNQVGMSAMLDLPVHTSMRPEIIATSQQMFLDRQQLKPVSQKPQPQDSGAGAKLQTSSQRTSTR